MVAPVIPQTDRGLVKICGLREVAHAVAAVEADADLIGFIFAPARRRVTPELAAAAISAARSRSRTPIWAVGVFVDAEPAMVNDVASTAGLDFVQLNGVEPPDFITSISVPVIRAHRLPAGTPVPAALDEIAAHQAVPATPFLHLIDGYHPEAHGGTGVRADWTLAAALAPRVPLALAGGLTPENVGTAIMAVQPRLVDVSSGVEIDDEKDAGRIREFVTAARAAFARAQAAAR